MLRTFHIIFLGLVLSITSSGQKQNENNKVLKIYSPVTTEYPTLSTKMEYNSFTKPFANDSLIILEDGIKTEVKSIDLIKTDQKLGLLFILVDIDSIDVRKYIKNLTIVDQHEFTAKVMLFNDSATFVLTPSNWLKNPFNWRGIYDTVNFNKLSTSYIGLYHKPTEVVVILTNDLNLKLAKLFKNKIQNEANINPPNLMLLYTGAQTGEIESLHKWASQQDIAIIQFSPEKSDFSPIRNYLKSIQNSRYIITWKIPKPLDLDTTRILQISMNGHNAKLKMSIPDTLIKNYFTAQTIKTADSLFSTKDNKGCLTLLNNRYALFKSPVFIEKTEEILGNQLIQLVENKGNIPLSSFLDLEAINNLPLGKDYQQERLRQIKELFNLVDQSDTLRSEQLWIAIFLVKAAPNDIENKYFLHWAKAKLNDSKGNRWKALDEFKLAYNITKNEKAKREITRLINACLNEAYGTKDWKRIKLYGQTYSDFYKPSFTLKYIYGIACFELSDYEEAISQFKWLLFNWENNNHISWDDAYSYLQKAYTNSSRFNEALILCQRVFFEKTDNKSLDLALLNLRLSWIKPAIDAFNLWLEKIPAEAQPEKSISLKRVTFPQFIGSVRLCDQKGETLGMLFENKIIPKQPSHAPVFDKKTISVQIENNLQWLVSGLVGNSAVAVMLDNGKIDEQEKNLLAAIRNEPTNNQVWNRLFTYEGKSNSRLLTQLYAAIISSSIQMNGAEEIDRFGELLKGSKFIQYILYQKRDGTVSYNFGFDAKMAAYKGDDWEKSSKITSLYFIEMKYNNNDIYEITNPIFNGTVWEGVLRIGIKIN